MPVKRNLKFGMCVLFAFVLILSVKPKQYRFCPTITVYSDGKILSLDIESYVEGVLAAEVPAEFEMEALKAQAIASRTFAIRENIIHKKHESYTVCSSEKCCQGFRPDRITDRIKHAVKETKGQIIMYGGLPIEALYFACSGGCTERAVDVWGSDLPYLQTRESPGEEFARCFMDEMEFSLDDLERLLQINLCEEPELWFSQYTYTAGGGVASVMVGDRLFTGKQIREALGLRSTRFNIELTDHSVLIHTEGYGHRVGMSQYGAEAMARAGKECSEILNYYYSGCAIKKWE